MPDERKDFSYVDLNGHRQRPVSIVLKGNRPKFQRWCFLCGRLTPASFGAAASHVVCDSCARRSLPRTN
jgi:hypothetical protein